MDVSPKSKPLTVADRFRFPTVNHGRKRAMTTNERPSPTLVDHPVRDASIRRESSYEDNCIFHCFPITSVAEDAEVEVKFNEDKDRREALFRAVDALALVEKPIVHTESLSSVDDVRHLRSAVDTAWSALYHAHPRRARAATVSTGRTIKRKSVPLPDLDGWTREPESATENPFVTTEELDKPSLLFAEPPLNMDASATVCNDAQRFPGDVLFGGQMRELEYCEIADEIAPEQRTVNSHSWLTSLGVSQAAESSSNVSIAELLGIQPAATTSGIHNNRTSKSATDRSLARRSGNLLGRLRRNHHSRIFDAVQIHTDGGSTSEEVESDNDETPALEESSSVSSSPSVPSPELRPGSTADGFFGMQPMVNGDMTFGQDRSVQSPIIPQKTLNVDQRWRSVSQYRREEGTPETLNLIGVQTSGGNNRLHVPSGFF